MLKTQAKVLIVDDDEDLRAAFSRGLARAGFEVFQAGDAKTALEQLSAVGGVDAVVTDLMMPGVSGIEFLKLVRCLDLDVPLIVVTGNPSLETAIETIRYGGFRYLEKPVELASLVDAVKQATAMHRLAILKRRALELYEADGWLLGDRAGLDAHFDEALDKLWLAFQPIVDCRARTVFGYEALVRSGDPTLKNPGLLFDAAERLDRLPALSRSIRRLLAKKVASAPKDALLFMNLHAADLNDPDLYDPAAPLSPFAPRIILEITERRSLECVSEVSRRVSELRSLGFRIAVDDLGAGYAGLSSFSQLEPDIAKLDMSLIRGVDSSPRKASLIRSMIAVCSRELDTQVVCEGVETAGERDTLFELGADLLQGYLFGRPDPEFCIPNWT